MQDKLFLRKSKDKVLEFFQNKTKANKILDILVFLFFAASFCSIPIFSFTAGKTIVTWILTIGFLVALFLDCLFFYGFSVDIISGGLLCFCLTIIISTALNGWKNFVITPIALAILTVAIYMFIKQNKKSGEIMLLVAFVGNIIFLFAFILIYRNELFSLQFERLGRYFGDQNDIAIFLTLGAVTSLFFILFKGGIVFKLINGFLALLFLFCAFSTGSKIFIVLLLVSLFTLSFMFFGKKRWWLALLVSIGVSALGFVLLWTVPALSSMKSRVISFINEIFNTNIPGGSATDMSTQGRFIMFLDGMDMFLRKPLLGWGINGFATFGAFNGGWSHNNISETFCNFGLIGTVLFHLGFVYSFIGYRKQKSKDNNIFLLILIFFIASMIGVALNCEKIYAFLIPIVFGVLGINTRIINIKHISLNKLGTQS